MSAKALLEKYFNHNSTALAIVLEHSRMVAVKALRIARILHDHQLDLQFIEEASLLHDIGVSRIHAPDIYCFGSSPYICHGILGRDILESEGFHRHAMVAERHIGVGLTADDIFTQNLPLPNRDMSPQSVEERIVCFADLFYSKSPGRLTTEKSPDEVRKGLERFGKQKLVIFDQWATEFAQPSCPNTL